MRKRIIALLLALILATFTFSACSRPGSEPADAQDSQVVPLETSKSPEESDDSVTDDDDGKEAEAPSTSTGSPVADTFTAFSTAKSIVITRINDGLSTNPDTTLVPLALLGVVMVDLALLPASFFGLGEEAVAAGLSYMGAKGIKHNADGNSYTTEYTNDEGVTTVFKGIYDPAAGGLTCTTTVDGKDSLYMEFRKTSFGYVGQYYLTEEDGSTYIYQVALQGEDGVLGISSASEKPSPLTGDETLDFPKSCPEWYAIFENTITGLTSDGEKLDFTFTPTADE